MSSVTGLQVITSLQGSDAIFTNAEHSGNNRTITPFTTATVGNAWIPWCDSSDQFPAHHMTIQVVGLTFYFWQSGEAIYWSGSGWSANASKIPGNSGIGQSVAWTLQLGGNQQNPVQITQTVWTG